MRGEAPRRSYADYRKLKEETNWPPKYMRLVLKFEDGTEWAFSDARRLGRIRLVRDVDPREWPPISLLGRDPFLDMPSLEEFSTALVARTAPVKAILLDQNAILAGLGNYLCDEILYSSRIHPSQRCNTLSDEQIQTLHAQIVFVVRTCVEAKADYRSYPESWLFSKRWGKGKGKAQTMTLEDGSEAPITFVTVGGRTSAVVASVQQLTAGVVREKVKTPRKKRVKEDDDTETTPTTPKRKRKQPAEVSSPYFEESPALLRTQTAPAALDAPRRSSRRTS